MLSQVAQWLLKEKYAGVESDLSACGLTPAQAEAFHADLKRLDEGEPLGYVIGYVPFLDCRIYLDSHSLIPRPETEYWVEKVCKQINTQVRGPNSNLRILDLCAGSGAIGIAVAKAIPDSQVTFGEIDKNHLPTIGKNLEVNNIPCTRYNVFKSDLFENIPGTFDYILSNPPYIDPIVDRAEKSVKDFEPHLALFGGKNGMEIIARIIAGARAKLAPGSSQLWLEHEPEQSKEIINLAKANGLKAEIHQDQYGVERYSVMVLQ